MTKNNSTGSTKSIQVVKSPAEFMGVLNSRWKIDWDLAATEENAQYENFITEQFYRRKTNKLIEGYRDIEFTKNCPLPGSFGVAWYGLSKNHLFLNPPFCNAEPACEPDCSKPKCAKRGSHNIVPQLGIGKWMENCKYESQRGAKIITLTLSSLGSKWYKDFVKGNAMSWILEGRMIFDGHTDVYPKELLLSEWGSGMDGLAHWDWKSQIPKEAPGDYDLTNKSLEELKSISKIHNLTLF